MKVAYISCANAKRDIENRRGLLDRMGAFLGALATLARREVQVLGLTEWGRHLTSENETHLVSMMHEFGWTYVDQVAKNTGIEGSFCIAVFVQSPGRPSSPIGCCVVPVPLGEGGPDGTRQAAGFACVDSDDNCYKIMFVHLSLDFAGTGWDEEVGRLCEACIGGEWSAVGDFNRIVEDFDRRAKKLHSAGLVYGWGPAHITFSPWAGDTIPAESFADFPELVSSGGQQFSPLDCVVGAHAYGVEVCLPLPHLPRIDHMKLAEKIAFYETSMRGVEPYQMVSDHFVIIVNISPVTSSA